MACSPRDMPVDTSRPNVARVYDLFLDGKSGFRADREEVARIEAAFPPPLPGRLPAPREMAVRNKQFVDKALSWASRQGIHQVLDLGCGLPVAGRRICLPDGTSITLRAAHEAAADGEARVRCAYVDHDPVAVSHVAALAADGKDVVAVQGDLTDPDVILANPAIRDCVDFAVPVIVVLTCVLQLFSPEQARDIAAAYVAAMAPGSALIVSCPRFDNGDLLKRARSAYTALPFWDHTPEEITSYFTGTQLVDPGVVPTRGWQGGWRDFSAADSATYVLGGLGVKA